MSPISKSEYLNSIKKRYKNSSKSEKQVILNEFCSICGYNRKYAIRLLNQESTPNYLKRLSTRGRKKQYDDPLILEVLGDI